MAYLEDELSSDEEYKHCAKACALFKSRATEGAYQILVCCKSKSNEDIVVHP